MHARLLLLFAVRTIQTDKQGACDRLGVLYTRVIDQVSRRLAATVCGCPIRRFLRICVPLSRRRADDGGGNCRCPWRRRPRCMDPRVVVVCVAERPAIRLVPLLGCSLSPLSTPGADRQGERDAFGRLGGRQPRRCTQKDEIRYTGQDDVRDVFHEVALSWPGAFFFICIYLFAGLLLLLVSPHSRLFFFLPDFV